LANRTIIGQPYATIPHTFFLPIWRFLLTDHTTTSGSSAGYLALVQENRNFRLLWFGQIVSLFGDWFNLIASAALISQLTDSGLAIGGLFVVRMLAPFLISPFAGVAADRYNRKHLLILADISRAVVVLGFLLVKSPSQVWLLYLLTFIQLAISGIFFPTRNAILPDIVSPRQLGPANALSSATWSVMLALGAALGGVVAGEWGIHPAFIIDAFTFILSAAFIVGIRYSPPDLLIDAQKSIRAALGQYVEGLRYLKENLDILVLTLHKSANGLFASGSFQVIQVALAEQVFVIGEGGGTSLGILYAITGVGTGIGPIIARWFTGDRDQPLRIAIALSYAITILGLILAAQVTSIGLVLLGTLLRAVGGGINWVFSTQLLLQLVPNQVRGRVFSTEFAGLTLANALGAALTGYILDDTALGISGLLWLLAILTAIPGILWLLWMAVGPRSKPAMEELA
jgi:MFS family permease